MCVRLLYVGLNVHARIICTPAFVRRGIISAVWWSPPPPPPQKKKKRKENAWNDIQNPDFKHGRPVELWRIDRLREQRRPMVKGMEIVDVEKEIDRWSGQKTSSPGVCSELCLGSEALGFMSVGIWRKSCSHEKGSGEGDARECVGHWGSGW